MKILHVITGLGSGGAERMLARLVAADRSGSNSHVVVALKIHGSHHLQRAITEAGARVIDLSMTRGPLPIIALVKLITILRRECPDVVMTWLYHADLLGTLASRMAGAQRLIWNVRCSELGPDDASWTTRITVRLLALLSFLPTLVGVNSVAGRKVHHALGYRPKRWVYLPNGVDTNVWAPNDVDRTAVRHEFGFAPKDVVIAAVARVHPMKDHQTLIQAAQLVHLQRPDTRIMLIGRGTEELLLSEEERQFIRAVGERDDVPRILRGCDIAVLASRSEGFPNAVGEAMSSGLPCVVTDVGDAASLVCDLGVVVPPRDPVALANGIESLIAKSTMELADLSVRVRDHIRANWSLEASLAAYRRVWHEVAVYGRDTAPRNMDDRVVEGFGDEWEKFDQGNLTGKEYEELFNAYFGIFPWNSLPSDARGFDLGCGSGRWARGVAPRVRTLHCIDPSERALDVARQNLVNEAGVMFHHAGVDSMPLDDSSMDFGYCLGVLHHVPDTAAGISAIVRKLKIGAPLLLYLYYSMDNRPRWYRLIHRASELLRWSVSRMPFWLRLPISQLIAVAVYWPMARTARLIEAMGWPAESMPLSAYRSSSFYTMRTDALDRFGTRLEQRFSREEVRSMMEAAGLTNISFSERPPYWCGVGFRAR